MTSEEKLQAVYDSENHFSISACWDGGFDVTFGTDHYVKATDAGKRKGIATENFKTAKEAIDWLHFQVFGRVEVRNGKEVVVHGALNQHLAKEKK